MLAAQRIESELPGIVEDPMLPEEILRPLIDNELPDAGIILADEVNNEIKIWDAEVSCRGGYHWVMGDVNSHTFADPPLVYLLSYQMGHLAPTYLALHRCMR